MRTNIHRATFPGWALALLLAANARLVLACGLDWNPPVNHFDGVNEHGMVSYWEALDPIELSDRLSVPLVVNFRSDNMGTSPYLGNGWMLPLLESRMYQLSEQHFLMVQPDGANRYFSRGSAEERTLKDQGGWVAEINGNTITAWAECGWKLVFSEGKISALCTPDNRQINYVYADGHVAEIREGEKVRVRVRVSGGQETVIESGQKSIHVRLDKRPIVEKVDGKNVVVSLAPSLGSISGDPANIKEYKLAVDDQMRPTLRIEGSSPRVLTWDPGTKLAVSDTGWIYKIKPGKDVFAYAAIERANPQNASEFWHHDRSSGIEIARSLDGTVLTSTYFTSGKLAGKLHHQEEIRDGKKRVLRRLSYDGVGHLARETDADGVTILYQYDDNQRLAGITHDAKPFLRRAYDNQGRVKEEELIGVDQSSYIYRADGSYQKISSSSDGSKTVLEYDRYDQWVTGTLDGQAVVSGGRETPSILPGTPEKRLALVKEVSAQLASRLDAAERMQVLIRIGSLYLDDTLGPCDPQGAISVFESIVNDQGADAYAKAQAFSWIASAYAQAGKAEETQGRQPLERLLALDGEGLPAPRREKLRAEQTEGFRHLLALLATGQARQDQAAWRKALEQYGSSEEFKRVLARMIDDQKRRLAITYLNN